MRILILIMFLAFSSPGFGQNNFLDNLDKTIRFPENYYNDFIWKDFFDRKSADQPIKLNEFDHNLFNATIYFLINEFREEASMESLVYSIDFESVAYNYVSYFTREEIVETAADPYRQGNIRAALEAFNFNGAYSQLLAATTISGVATTYFTLAREVVLNFKYADVEVLRQPAFSIIGIRSIVDPETKFVTTVIIFGGHRLNWLNEE